MSVAIRVKPDTRDQLKAMKRGDDTYDDTIKRLIYQLNQCQGALSDAEAEVDALEERLQK